MLSFFSFRCCTSGWCLWRWLVGILFITWTLPWVIQTRAGNCAQDCTCISVRGMSSTGLQLENAKRVKCNNPVAITSMEVFISQPLPVDTIYLDVSGNSITVLTNGSFNSLTRLERLNLAENRLNIIRPGAFVGLENLKLLNLSYNNLRTLGNNVFEGLSKLEKLFLNGNHLSKLDSATFKDFTSLRTLNLSHNPLICDCHLSWIINWTAVNDVKFWTRAVCQFPHDLRGVRLHKVKPNQWHCNWTLHVPVFQLRPSESQIVFKGDSLKFTCHVSKVDSSSRLIWALNNKDMLMNSKENDVILDVQTSADETVLMGTLQVNHLKMSHGGTWTCWLYTSKGNVSQSVIIRVLSEDTKFCPQSVTSGNKGYYVWPRTVERVTVKLPCWTPTSSSSGRRLPVVTRVCNEHGTWGQLDTSSCPYISEVTKVLEQFSKTNLNITSSSVIDSVQHLKNYTGDGSLLRDKMDVVFIVKTINKYLEFVPKYKEIVDILIGIIATVMHLNSYLLREAQLEDRACSRLVEAIERLPELITDGNASHEYRTLAVKEFVVKVDSFQGITCASFTRNSAARDSHGRNLPSATLAKNILRCKFGNLSIQLDKEEDEILDASIRIPSSLFRLSEWQHSSNHRLQFTYYYNASLFPRTKEPNYKLNVLSSVIGGKLVKISATNLTEPILVTIRSPSLAGEIFPVWWDFYANGKLGDWSKEGCKLWKIYDNLVSFHCDRLANYGLLQDVEQVERTARRRLGGAEFRLLHPAVYVGSAICVLCLLSAIVTYILGYRLIHVSKKNKHSLINTWLATVLLCLTFTLGVRHTENAKICQGVGLVLHYLTLVCLHWMIITADNTHKKLNRSEPRESPPDEPPADYPLPPKPMLRFYLVGWGVPVIICGISGAVNMEDYAGYNYCFLAFTHSVGAIYAPTGVLIFILCIYYLLIFCALRRVNAGGAKHRRPVVNGNDIELVDTAGECAEIASQHSAKPPSDGGSDEDDMEHTPLSQLRYQVVLLIIFLLCWAAAAIVVAEPFFQHSSLDDLLFSSAYAASVVALGLFVIMFHCIAREDVRLVWKLLSRCRDSGIVRDTERLPPPMLAADGQVDHVRHSSDSLHSSYTNKSGSTSHSLGDAKVRLPKVCNVDGAAANAGGVTDTSWSGEMFYNPYQKGVARKFFRKHSRQQQLQQRIKNDCLLNDAEQAMVRNTDRMPRVEDEEPAVVETLPRLRFPPELHSRPVGDKVVKASRVVCRDLSTESQLVNSSSQGLVSISPSHSGNCSDQSLLIVEEEEEEDVEGNADDKEAVAAGEIPEKLDNDHQQSRSQSVDWGPRGQKEIVLDATFSPSPTDGSANDVFRNGVPESNLMESVEQNAQDTVEIVESPSSQDDDKNEMGQKLPQKSGTLPRSSWDKQCQESKKSKQPVYAYVNHSYHQKLGDILGKQFKVDNGNDGYKGVTRSVSTGDAEMMTLGESLAERSTVHPSLEMGHWLHEPKLKKETAV